MKIHFSESQRISSHLKIPYSWSDKFTKTLVRLTKNVKASELYVLMANNSLSFYFKNWNNDLSFLDQNEEVKFQMLSLEQTATTNFSWNINIVDNENRGKQLVFKTKFN